MKQDLLKSEYYKLEAACRAKNADIVAELAVYKERIGTYEAIEHDLDQAIIAAAESTSVDGDGHILDTIHSAPTASKRRIQ